MLRLQWTVERFHQSRCTVIRRELICVQFVVEMVIVREHVRKEEKTMQRMKKKLSLNREVVRQLGNADLQLAVNPRMVRGVKHREIGMKTSMILIVMLTACAVESPGMDSVEQKTTGVCTLPEAQRGISGADTGGCGSGYDYTPLSAATPPPPAPGMVVTQPLYCYQTVDAYACDITWNDGYGYGWYTICRAYFEDTSAIVCQTLALR